jgi:hypothetical protein
MTAISTSLEAYDSESTMLDDVQNDSLSLSKGISGENRGFMMSINPHETG